RSRVADAIDAPLLFNMLTKGGKTPYVPTDELGRMGYDISSLPRMCSVQPFLACVVCCRSCVRHALVNFSQRLWASRNTKVLSMRSTISNFRKAICVWINGMEGVWNA